MISYWIVSIFYENWWAIYKKPLARSEKFQTLSTFYWHKSSLWNGTTFLLTMIHNGLWYPLGRLQFIFIQIYLFARVYHRLIGFTRPKVIFSKLVCCTLCNGKIENIFGYPLYLDTIDGNYQVINFFYKIWLFTFPCGESCIMIVTPSF